MDEDDLLALSDDELVALPSPICPGCGDASGLVPLIYGMPNPDDPLFQRAQRGEVDVEFAGCVIPAGPLPQWRCRRCNSLVAADGAAIVAHDE